jgi:hypothetical protein
MFSLGTVTILCDTLQLNCWTKIVFCTKCCTSVLLSSLISNILTVYHCFSNLVKFLFSQMWGMCDRYYACGPWAGKLFCLVVVINFIVWCFLEWQQVHPPFHLRTQFGNSKAYRYILNLLETIFQVQDDKFLLAFSARKGKLWWDCNFPYELVVLQTMLVWVQTCLHIYM